MTSIVELVGIVLVIRNLKDNIYMNCSTRLRISANMGSRSHLWQPHPYQGTSDGRLLHFCLYFSA
jgi:hypothetical protein